MAVQETIDMLGKYVTEKQWVSLIRAADGGHMITGVPSKLRECSNRDILYVEFNKFLDGPDKNRKLDLCADKPASLEIPYALAIQVQPVSQKRLDQLLQGDEYRVGF